MLPGSLYYHFAVQGRPARRGLRRRRAPHQGSGRRGVGGRRDPWTRLEAACAAHLEALLEDSDYAQVVIRVRPDDAPDVAARLVALRDEYEGLFAERSRRCRCRRAPTAGRCS